MTILARAETASGAADETGAGSFLVGLIFFVSGMPALVYQLIWQRSLFTMYGSNIEAVTVVVAGFLLGLGFGSLAGGYVSRRVSRHLLTVFGTTELVIGAFGILSLRIFALVGKTTLDLPPVALTAVTLALLFVPTLFMGSTLPVLSAYLVRRSRNVGSSVGLLYCVNTAGSAVACLLSALFLMRSAGMQGAVTIAAAINAVVGSAALAEAWRTRRVEAPERSRPARSASMSEVTGALGPDLKFTIALAALVGYVSLSYEIVWFRAFSLATNTSAAFALVLGAYLAGIANGALRVRRLFDRSWTTGAGLQATAIAILATSILGFALLPAAAASAMTPIGYFYPMLIMVFLQTTVGGTIFPIVCHLAISPDDRAGAGVSWIYVANIIGSVAGTLVTGFVLMDDLSIAQVSAFLALFGIAVAVAVALRREFPAARRRLIVAAGAVAALGIPAAAGVFFERFYDRLLVNNVLQHEGDFIDVVENRSGVITVDPAGYVYGSGVYDGRIAVDLMDDQNILLRPLSLSLFHPNPESVLLVGLGTGAWAQVIANNPAVKHVTLVEINPGYLKVIAQHPVVESLLRNPKVEIVIDDGRRWLNRHPDRKFDAIVQNTTWYWRSNVTNLLSSEYLALTAAHLRDGGVILYNTTGSLRVQRTACTAFPNGFRVVNAMVVSPRPIAPDPMRLWQTLVAYRIDGRPLLDVADARQRARLDEIVSMLTPADRPTVVIEDCASILARSGDLQLITDDNMGEEWMGLVATDPLLQRFHALQAP
jgi:spermidine synthase